MKKYRIKGMLAGDRIDISCTENQAAVIRDRLADWLDEETRVNNKDRFSTGIDNHRGMSKEPGDMIRGGG